MPSAIYKQEHNILFPAVPIVIIIDPSAIPPRYFYNSGGGCRADKINKYDIILYANETVQRNLLKLHRCVVTVARRERGACRLHVVCEQMEVGVVGDHCTSRPR